uniref:Uncharacterized protein n=1 Tax=Setaria italica TaxID=4555 RepID=K3ZGL5_SETIT
MENQQLQTGGSGRGRLLSTIVSSGSGPTCSASLEPSGGGGVRKMLYCSTAC